MARVLPVPAPASTQTGPRAARATSRCSGSSPASSASDVPGITSATGSSCPIRGTQPPPPVLQNLDLDEVSSRRRRVSGQLTMYTTPWCGYCRNLKRQLARDGIEMLEIDIERDAAAAEFVMSVNGGNQTVPTVLFPDGTALTNPSAAQVKAQLSELPG